MNTSWIIGVQHVWFGISIFLLLLLLVSRTLFFREAILAKQFSRRHLVLFIVIFSLMALCGSYWNVSAGGGIMNFRAVGIMLGGFVGGPIVGTIVGCIAGIHRALFFDTDAAFIHGGLSIIQGIAAGYLANPLKSHHHNLWSWSFFYAGILEILFWLFFAFFNWPKTVAHPNDFFDLSLPIIIMNTIAVSLFYMVLEFYTHQRDTEKSETTKTTFEAVNTLFSALHDGFNGFNVSKATEIVTASLPSLIWTAIRAMRRSPSCSCRNPFRPCRISPPFPSATRVRPSAPSSPLKVKGKTSRTWAMNSSPASVTCSKPSMSMTR